VSEITTKALSAWIDELPDHLREVVTRLHELKRQSDKSTADQLEALEVIGQLSACLMANHAEVKQLNKRIESQTDWYQQRFDTLRVWVDTEVKPLSEEVAHRYFSICANGSPAPHESGEWKDTLHGLRLERDSWKRAAESQNKQWSAKCEEVTELRAENERLKKMLYDIPCQACDIGHPLASCTCEKYGRRKL
jgi:DNA repair exonuclease SbcCD ATPase subunit